MSDLITKVENDEVESHTEDVGPSPTERLLQALNEKIQKASDILMKHHNHIERVQGSPSLDRSLEAIAKCEKLAKRLNDLTEPTTEDESVRDQKCLSPSYTRGKRRGTARVGKLQPRTVMF